MKAETFQTLHPVPGKTNKSISKAKYERVKEALLSILESQALTHTDLMEALYQQIGFDFEGGVQWYGEVVKLDLEARGLLVRRKGKPELYARVNQSGGE